MMENFKKIVENVLPICAGPTGNIIMFGPVDPSLLSHLLKDLLDSNIRIDSTNGRYSFSYVGNWFTIW